ncbi:uncharacterized protein LOC123221808 [Mangifera indica]|uniref:uncharacterized protein LOC123221808 n=1 Tax=Mangifera indica TaxID=29780 RepID=UPI001CFABEC6|nr:uncharacterized protein LOC123221808 [Mangifera indica]
MSAFGATPNACGGGGENRFYNPPHIRKQQQERQLRQRQEREREDQKLIDAPVTVAGLDKRGWSDECESSPCCLSESTNLDRFLEYTTPTVPAQYLPETSVRRWGDSETEICPYFLLGDLWESYREWSAYGAGVPLLLDGNESVKQYYVPFLSAIQLYTDPSRPSIRLRKPDEESDVDTSRETSSDGSSDYGVERQISAFVQGTWSQQNTADENIQKLYRLSLRNKHLMGSSSDESEICNPHGKPVFEYLEHDAPFSREPLADKISVLASGFPELKTYRSCDLLPSSWISVAWYPMYRIPMGPTLQNLDACFLTFHSLSKPFQSRRSDGLCVLNFTTKEVHRDDMSFKLSLPTFGLASYKFKVPFWNHNGLYESLLQAADNWLKLLQVKHPEYIFFISRNSSFR